MSHDDLKIAFGLTIVEVEGAGGVTVADLFSAFSDNAGDPRKQAKAILQILGETGWSWPRYAEHQKRLGLDSLNAKEMARVLVHRVDRIQYWLMRRKQMLKVAGARPHWKLIPGEQCLGRTVHSTIVIKPFDNPFWNTTFPPCEAAECHCYVESLSDRDMVRLGLDLG